MARIQTLLWLWPRLVATAPIQPLAWEPPYAVGVAQEIAKKDQKKKKKLQKLNSIAKDSCEAEKT